MSRRVPCPLCSFVSNSNAGVFKHAKEHHSFDVAQYLDTHTNGEEFKDRPIYHDPTNNDEDSLCGDGECPCWERKLGKRPVMH